MTIHERFLRHIWGHQYLSSDLKTWDGKPVSVVSSGKLNEDGGPDFHGAIVRIGGILYRGDVEIHRNVSEWLRHGHQKDPAYNTVILHVAYEGDPLQFPTLVQSGRTVPTLLMHSQLSQSAAILFQKAVLDEYTRSDRTLPCASLNGFIRGEVLEGWINKVARERLEFKIRRLEERLREIAQMGHTGVFEDTARYEREDGDPREIPLPEDPDQRIFLNRSLWDQILYEAIMDVLGYSKNRDPFVRLARNASLSVIKSVGAESDSTKLEALLLGVSGLLLPVRTTQTAASREKLQALHRHWNTLENSIRCERLHLSHWQFFPTRPSNFPPRRIAAAVSIIQSILSADMFRNLIQTVRTSPSLSSTLSGLLRLLQVRTDSYWATHYRFDVPSARRLNPLGRARSMDIIANAFIPLVFLYARVFRKAGLRGRIDMIYNHFPRLSTNSVLRKMEQQLLKKKLSLNSLRLQQGVIQLHNAYCIEQRCGECDIGKLLF